MPSKLHLSLSPLLPAVTTYDPPLPPPPHSHLIDPPLPHPHPTHTLSLLTSHLPHPHPTHTLSLLTSHLSSPPHSHLITTDLTPASSPPHSRLYGGYKNIEGGDSGEAMEDFTGGVVQSFDLTQKNVGLFERIERTLNLHMSLLTCSIQTGDSVAQANGLVTGHAYSVIGTETVH